MTEFTTWRSLVDGAVIGNIPDSEVPQADIIEHYDAISDSQTTGSIATVPGIVNDFDLTGSGSLIDDGINGNRSYSFNGDDDTFSETFESDETQPNTAFIVLQLNDTNGNYTAFDGINQRQELFTGQDPDVWEGFAGETLRTDISISTDPLVITIVFDGAGSIIRVNQTEGAEDIGDTDMDGITLGSLQDGSGRFWDGEIGEVVFANVAVDSQTIEDEEERMADRWGITL